MNLEELGALGKVISSSQVQKITGLGRTVLDKLNAEGVLTKIYFSDRKYVYRLDQVNAYVTSCMNNPTKAKGESSADKARKALEAKKAKQWLSSIQ
nr:hypothetical protein [Providencia rettgeri]